ncbi:DUF805 domain-containing protein [Ursidibacter sp. B-7004-1]
MRRTRTNYAIRAILTSGMITIISNLMSSGGEFNATLFLLLVFISLSIHIYLATGRLKDMNVSPWWAALVIIPFVGFILMFPKGTKGANRYGEDPRELKKG